MFNAAKPSLDQLPSSSQLLRSTFIAAVAAVAILVTVILPAEYAIDPTGAGRLMGLTEMGEIKRELEDEAERDREKDRNTSRRESTGLSIATRIFGLLIGTAHAQDKPQRSDEVTFSLKPGETHELKLSMKKGGVAAYDMAVEGGRVNFDLHAHGGGQSITYKKGRGSKGSEGEFTAAFDGSHGWFWRNRDRKPLTVRLKLRGAYSEIQHGK